MLLQGDDSSGFSPNNSNVQGGSVQDMLRSPVANRMVNTPSPQHQNRSSLALSRPLGVTSPGTQEQLLR